MLNLSELMLQRHDLDSFDELLEAVKERARQGERFFRIDVKPSYPDTPENWEEVLESVFTGRL
ncbi:sulfur relay protein DsrC [Endothiovibrio diazotrophicus]